MESRNPGEERPDARRTFVAVFPPEPVVREVLRELPRLTGRWPDLRPVRGDTLHLTLRFLGDRDRGERDRVAARLEAIAAAVRPFPVRLAGLGTFPPERPPRVLWLGVGEGEARLAALARSVERELRAAGFGKADHAFRPHLTLGRFRRPPDPDGSLPPFPDPPPFAVAAMDLVTSVRGPGGSRYTVERRASFGAGPTPPRPAR